MFIALITMFIASSGACEMWIIECYKYSDWGSFVESLPEYRPSLVECQCEVGACFKSWQLRPEALKGRK
jgi:hypothetical protein